MGPDCDRIWNKLQLTGEHQDDSMNKLLNKKTAIELKFAKSFGQKAKNCTVRREEKGIRGRPKGGEKRVEKDKIA